MFDARAIFWVHSSPVGRLINASVILSFNKKARKFKWEDTKKQLSFVYIQG